MPGTVIFSVIDCSVDKFNNTICIYELQALNGSCVDPQAYFSNSLYKGSLFELYRQLIGSSNFVICGQKFASQSAADVYDDQQAGKCFDAGTFLFTKKHTVSTWQQTYFIEEPRILYDKIEQKKLLKNHAPALIAPFFILEFYNLLNEPVKNLLRQFYQQHSQKSFILKFSNYTWGEGNVFFDKETNFEVFYQKLIEKFQHKTERTAILEVCINHTPIGEPKRVERLAHMALYDANGNLIQSKLVHIDTHLSDDYNSHTAKIRQNHLSQFSYNFDTRLRTSLEAKHALSSDILSQIDKQLKPLFESSIRPHCDVAVVSSDHHVFPDNKKNHDPSSFKTICLIFIASINISDKSITEQFNKLVSSSLRKNITANDCEKYKTDILQLLGETLLRLLDGKKIGYSEIVNSLNHPENRRLRKRIWNELIAGIPALHRFSSPCFEIRHVDLVDWLIMKKRQSKKIPAPSQGVKITSL